MESQAETLDPLHVMTLPLLETVPPDDFVILGLGFCNWSEWLLHMKCKDVTWEEQEGRICRDLSWPTRLPFLSALSHFTVFFSFAWSHFVYWLLHKYFIIIITIIIIIINLILLCFLSISQKQNHFSQIVAMLFVQM